MLAELEIENLAVKPVPENRFCCTGSMRFWDSVSRGTLCGQAAKRQW